MTTIRIRSTQRVALFLLCSSVLTLAPAAATAGAQVDCGVPPYEGVVCQGFFTDEPDIVDNHQRLEDAIGRVVAKNGNPIAVVVVTDSRGRSPAAFARDLADTWGVGDPAEQNGILLLVSLEERRIEVVTQDNVAVNGEVVAATATSFFQAGDFEGGLLAMVGTIDQILSGGTAPVSGTGTNMPALLLLGAFAAVAVGGIGIWWRVSTRRKEAERIRRQRERLIDGDLDGLEPAGQELPRLEEYALGPAPGRPVVDTREALASLTGMLASPSRHPGDDTAALWAHGLVVVVDRYRMIADTREPLELRSNQERPLLESAVQQAANDALEVSAWNENEFRVRRGDLQSLIEGLRPHRVAAARRRIGDTLSAELVESPLGWTGITGAGRRFVEAGPALDPDEPMDESIREIDLAYETADAKASRLETLYSLLPSSTTRPAVAAALTDIGEDPEEAVRQYEEVRRRLSSEGNTLTADGLEIPAIAALLMMNNDAGNVVEFIEAYDHHRKRGSEPPLAVEYALAGLLSPGEIKQVRSEAKRLDLPVSITAGLLRRRDDGPEVFEALRDELASHVSSSSAKTIAGILAMSLEPSQALRRWLAAREALENMGLLGTYADVAAAFGASDPRGPRAFALSYAAQRSALAKSGIDDADRFAPELAHAGTSGRTDTWTGRPLPATFGSFDPFTFFYYHWVITRGHAGSYGWEPVYRHSSWSDDRSSWWGGGGGFGSSGGGSWGGSSSGGSFGGFGGGGGFSGGGGGGW